jgi:hypothetical protein
MALLAIGVSACDDDTGTGSISVDLSGMVTMDAGVDMAAVNNANAQITVADVSGYIPLPMAGVDGGVPTLVHTLAAIASFPSHPDNSTTHDPDPLHGCSWHRYDITAGNLPIPDENAGNVTISGYDYANLEGINIGATPRTTPMHPDPTIACTYSSASFSYNCKYATSGESALDVIFPPLPGPTEQHPIPSSSPIAEAFVPNTQATPPTTYPDKVSASISGVPDAFTIVSITVDGTALPGIASHTLNGLQGFFDGTHDITISWSCDGNLTTPKSGCPTSTAGKADLVGFLVRTSLTPSFSTPSAQFGTAQCVDESGNSTTGAVKLTKSAIATIIGSQTGQTIQLTLAHLKAAPSFSGQHLVFLTAGHGEFAFLTQ